MWRSTSANIAAITAASRYIFGADFDIFRVRGREGGREGRRASCFGEIRDRFVLGILQEGNGHKEHAATEAIKSGLPCMSVKFKCSKTFAKV